MREIRYIVCVVFFALVTASITNAQDTQPRIVQEINDLPANSDKATYDRLLTEFAKTGLDIKEIEPGILTATNDGNYEIVSAVERIVLPSQSNVQSLVDYYLHIGTSIGACCKKPQESIEYITKAIELAEQNDLKKKLFSSAEGFLNHAWGDVAVNYQRLNDFKNASIAYLKAGQEIKKYYPLKTKVYNRFTGLSAYSMFRYLSETYKGKDARSEYLPYLIEYSETGNLNELSSLWNHFINSHDIDGLNAISAHIIPKERDQKAIAEFYWAAAESLEYDGLYQDAIDYHLKLMGISLSNNFTNYLYTEIDGVKHSRYEFIANCFDKLGADELYVRSMFNAITEATIDFGAESKEVEYYACILAMLMDDTIKGPILQKILDEVNTTNTNL